MMTREGKESDKEIIVQEKFMKEKQKMEKRNEKLIIEKWMRKARTEKRKKNQITNRTEKKKKGETN